MKRADSQYVTNSRAADWVKVKPEYADQMGEVRQTMLGVANVRISTCWSSAAGGAGADALERSPVYCLGSGFRRRTMVRGRYQSQCHLMGAALTYRFQTFASVGSGMSYEDYEWIL